MGGGLKILGTDTESGWLANIASFGAAGRLDEALAELQAIQDWYTTKANEVEARRRLVQGSLEKLVVAKQRAHASLTRLRDLTVGLSARERTFIAEHPPVGGVRTDLGKINATLEAGDFALAAAKGGGAAVSTALGAWALVGTFGAASTGTALSSLSGAVAFNATLAWFGGGSIAAGGAGMAGGAVVLGGIVAVPALALMAMFSHISANKKIAEIKAHAVTVLQEGNKFEQALIVLRAVESRAKELTMAVDKAREAFDHEFGRTAAALRRPWYSRLWMCVRGLFGAPRYTPSEVEQIAQIGSVATVLARIIDQPILDKNGAPT
jgi:hypothetical protein